MFADLVIFVEEGYWLLTNELNAAQCKFDRERLLINGFEEAWSQLAVNPYGRCDDALGALAISQPLSYFPAFLIHFQIVPAVAVSSQPGLRGNGVVAMFS